MNFQLARRNMIDQQIRPWEVLDQNVLDLFFHLHREDFMPAEYRSLAFADTTIPIGHGQYSMSPKMEARLLQHVALGENDQVLEIGTGSGWLTCLLAHRAASVVSIDIHADFTTQARKKLGTLGIDNVQLDTCDIFHWDNHETFDAIIITGSLPFLDPSWEKRLNRAGRLFYVSGQPPVMEAVLLTLNEHGLAATESLFETSLPALIGAEENTQFQF